MPAPELILRFPSPDQVVVAFAGIDSGLLPFANPVTEEDRKAIAWYIETYGVQSLAGDEAEARRVEQRLPEIGKALFDAVFGDRAGQRLFDRFQDADEQHRVLTIDSQSAAVLALPWELLHDPAGVFLFRERPRISVRRRIGGATGGRDPFAVQPKPALHLLFVVSRPNDAGFIDPRADPAAVLDALDGQAPGRVTCEFLRPPTLNALEQRLDDDALPAVDILHFDGHGVFRQVSEQDAEADPERYGRAVQSEIQRERAARGAGDDKAAPVGIGFLLFERADGSGQLISAEDLHANLFRARVGLVVLSACQSAALDTDGDPMASVAGRLTATGIPAILAMTHSVLVATTRALFGQFYQSLARGRGIARALDDARAWLDNNPDKHQVRRGNQRRALQLQDWFLPALFHAGADHPLLTAETHRPRPPQPLHNLRPAQEAGFFGRRRELWRIERWLADPDPKGTRRISITGFGGQGKTELALEAARWLLRIGAFERACLIDYAGVQGADALAVAVGSLAAVLGENLPDAEAAGRALAAAPTLVVLDNLETLAPAPLAELLDAAAAWTEPAADGSERPTRLLLTSRRPDHDHPAYPIQGSYRHRRIALDGLGSAADPDDALAWHAALAALPAADDEPALPPPDRDALIDLFHRVAFHPLSIAVLAQQLRSRSAAQLGQRLDALLAADACSAIAEAGTPASLLASLELSLDRLDPDQRRAIGRLGVFEGGAMEDDLLAITGLGGAAPADDERARLQALLDAVDGDDPAALLALVGADLPAGAELPPDLPPDLLAQLRNSPEMQAQLQALRDQLAALPAPPPAAGSHPDPWPALRRQLEAAALMEAERIPGVGPPFLRFHPTLAPLLWAGLTPDERTELTLAHRRRYYQLAGYLYHADRKSPDQARAIARRELPNLLQAVDRALAAGDEDAVEFVETVNRFLTVFGRTREAAALTRRAEQAGGAVGSRPWFLAQSNRGEQLLAAGQVAEAAACFQAILQALGDAPSYELALTLGRLGRCYGFGGRPDLAEAQHRRGIEVTLGLEQGEQVKRHRGALHTDLGDVLTQQGRFDEARAAYETSLEIKREISDPRGVGVSLGQLGTLALQQGDLTEAVRRYQEALALFQRLGEPTVEAQVQHQLGLAFQQARQWEQAERHYREAASLKEQRGDLAGAAQTWNQLAVVCELSGRPEAAETWYRKAIDGGKATGDTVGVSKGLSNLAGLLLAQPDRLAEARRLAEEALAIMQTLDPGAAQIWKTYNILAQIAERQSRPDAAAAYRRQARDAKRRFAGTAHELKRHLPLIRATVAAVADPAQAPALDQALTQRAQHGWTRLVAAIRRLLAGERDADALCAELDPEDAMIVETILQALDDPAHLHRLAGDDPPGG